MEPWGTPHVIFVNSDVYLPILFKVVFNNISVYIYFSKLGFCVHWGVSNRRLFNLFKIGFNQFVANEFFIYDTWEVTLYLWYYFHIFLSILPSANGVAVSRVSRFCAYRVRIGQSLRGGAHIFPSSLFFINRKHCFETGVRHLLSVRTVYKWGPRAFYHGYRIPWLKDILPRDPDKYLIGCTNTKPLKCVPRKTNKST